MVKNNKTERRKIKIIAENGITLVALVITIVILIILATVTINFAFGEDGLIAKAQQAKELTEQATRKEEEELNSLMGKLNEIISGEGIDDSEESTKPSGSIEFEDYVWAGDGTASIVIQSTASDYTLQYQIVGDESEKPESNKWNSIASGTSITGLKHGDTVYGRLWDGKNESNYTYKEIEDNDEPTYSITEPESSENLTSLTVDEGETITLKVNMYDDESGIDLTECKWMITGIDNEYNSFTSDSKEITCVMENVGTYILEILIQDKAGNSTMARVSITVSSGPLVPPTPEPPTP